MNSGNFLETGGDIAVPNTINSGRVFYMMKHKWKKTFSAYSENVLTATVGRSALLQNHQILLHGIIVEDQVGLPH